MSEALNPYMPPESQLASDEKKCDSCNNIIKAKAEICPHCGVRQRKPVSKAALLLLTFFFGGIGAHKFYLGKNWLGVLYLVFFWTYIPGIIALVEFIIYAFTSSDRLNEKYSAEGSTVAIIVVVVVFVLFIGILAAIAIPVYQDYTVRAKIHGVDSGIREQVTTFVARTNQLPSSSFELDLALDSASEKIVSSINVDSGGHITVTFSSPIEGQTIAYEPVKGQNIVERWVCTGGTLKHRYRPINCRE